MDVPLAILVLSYGFLAFQDNIVAWYWAARIGPARARLLITRDPVFTETRDSLHSIEHDLAKVDLRLDTVVHDVSAETTAVRQEIRGLKADILSEVRSSIATASKDTNVYIDPAAEDRLLKGLTSRLRANLGDAVKDSLVEVIKEQGGTDETAVAGMEAQYEMQAVGTMLIEDYGVPEEVVTFAEKYAPVAARVFLMGRYPEEYEAAMGVMRGA